MGVIKNNIPNFITCLNLACGCLGIMFCIQGQVGWIPFLVLFAAIFDFLDGFIARLLNVTSPIGRDLDSLADIITFGLLPGMMLWQVFLMSDDAMLINYPGGLIMSRSAGMNYLSFSAILIPIFSAIRLAKFNNDADQIYHFKGLPTPVNGIFLVCTTYWMMTSLTKPVNTNGVPDNHIPERYSIASTDSFGWIDLIYHPVFLLCITIILSILLVSNIKLMAFKFKSFGWKENQWKYILLILCLPLAIWFGFASAPIILILYILISQIHFRTTTRTAKGGESMSTIEKEK